MLIQIKTRGTTLNNLYSPLYPTAKLQQSTKFQQVNNISGTIKGHSQYKLKFGITYLNRCSPPYLLNCKISSHSCTI